VGGLWWVGLKGMVASVLRLVERMPLLTFLLQRQNAGNKLAG